MDIETKITVRDAMTPNVITAPPNISVAEAAAIMSKKRVGSIIIKDNSGPIGLVTESDIIRKVVAKDLKASEVKVSEIMTKNLITIEPESEIREAAHLMAKNNIRRLPVVKNGVLVGIITSTDIMVVAPELTEILVENARMKENEFLQREEREESIPGVCEICGTYAEYLEEVDGKFVCEDCKRELKGE
ncbi:putative signal transduction protein with CBS domains [Methanothermus fervidus DSM 2088]|uniref:Putative signal transduction protein with CBS domains n=1 Tax=Methanothermus fervidus (strain ATCC 43054 / DSM 2088 / JCM 10308 / V24 S) TaxID=523846 RepID=E3GXK7_METFV|nr:CBS domain-containing protein [Methanothermus fervidus]ADP77039.1 putative signal transduction protein with CBS domains [Methanothermus fervidus DSM 2088]